MTTMILSPLQNQDAPRAAGKQVHSASSRCFGTVLERLTEGWKGGKTLRVLGEIRRYRNVPQTSRRSQDYLRYGDFATIDVQASQSVTKDWLRVSEVSRFSLSMGLSLAAATAVTDRAAISAFKYLLLGTSGEAWPFPATVVVSA